MTRMSAERLSEIEALRRDNREACHWGHVGDLLDELAAVTRERDAWIDRAGINGRIGFEVLEERDALRAEVSRLKHVNDLYDKQREQLNDMTELYAKECAEASRLREALNYGLNRMMPEIHSQRTSWPGEVDEFEDRARAALEGK